MDADAPKLGRYSAFRQVTLLATHLLVGFLPEPHLRKPLFTYTVFADPILALPGFVRGSFIALGCLCALAPILCDASCTSVHAERCQATLAIATFIS